MAGPKFDRPETPPKRALEALSWTPLRSLRLSFRPRSRMLQVIPTQAPDKIGTAELAFAAKIGVGNTGRRSNVSRERSFSDDLPADHTSGRLWTTPSIGIPWRATP